MLKSLGIHRGLTWLIVFVSIGAASRPVLAQGPGCAGDLDADGDVDLLDYAELSVCFSGPNGGAGGADCASFDLDGDVDIDLSDFTLFSQGFTGPPGDCPPGQTNCDGTCTSTASDPANCGYCGNFCWGTDTCTEGVCTPCVPSDIYGPCYCGPEHPNYPDCN